MRRILFYPLLLFTVISCGGEQQTQPVRKTIQEAVFASGQITQDDEYVVSANADGILLEIPVKEGDTVQENTLLARIKSDVQNAQAEESRLVYRDAVKNSASSSPQLLQIMSEINQAKSQLASDRLNYERYAGLRKTNTVSPLELENAELRYKASQNSLVALQKKYDEAQNALKLNAARSRTQWQAQQDLLDYYTLAADKAGRVINVYKKKGELVRKGEVIARIGSGPYIVKLYVSEEDIVRVRAGQKAAVSLNTYPDSSFTAKITRVLPAFDEVEQSYVAEAHFILPPEVILSGTQLQANIVTGIKKGVLLVPANALIKDNTVLLKDGNQKKVTTGRKYGSFIEVKYGLTTSDVLQIPEQEKKESGDMMQTN